MPSTGPETTRPPMLLRQRLCPEGVCNPVRIKAPPNGHNMDSESRMWWTER